MGQDLMSPAERGLELMIIMAPTDTDLTLMVQIEKEAIVQVDQVTMMDLEDTGRTLIAALMDQEDRGQTEIAILDQADRDPMAQGCTIQTTTDLVHLEPEVKAALVAQGGITVMDLEVMTVMLIVLMAGESMTLITLENLEEMLCLVLEDTGLAMMTALMAQGNRDLEMMITAMDRTVMGLVARENTE